MSVVCAVGIVATGLTGPAVPLTLLLVACAALAWRRVHPTWSVFILGSAVLLAWVIVVFSSPETSTWTVCAGGALLAAGTFSAVSYGPRWFAWTLLPIVLATAFVAGAVVSGVDFTQAMTSAIATALLAWTLGQWRYNQRSYVASLLERTRRAEHEREQQAQLMLAQERARISREVHDIVAHSLALMTAQADGARYVLPTSPQAATDALLTIATTGRTAMCDMGDLLGMLASDDEDVPSAALQPQPNLTDIAELVDSVRDSGLKTSLRISGEERSLPSTAQLAVFRLVQESLTNALKHGGHGTTADITLLWSPCALQVDVINDGRGDGPTMHSTGRGLLGMRERVAQIGGKVEFEQQSQGGFAVRASIPVTGAAANEDVTL